MESASRDELRDRSSKSNGGQITQTGFASSFQLEMNLLKTSGSD